MLIGVLEMELYLPQCNSLKAKRMVIKGLKEKLNSRFNISVAECENQDLWQRSSIVIVSVSNNGAKVNSLLSKVVKFINQDRRVDILDYSISFR